MTKRPKNISLSCQTRSFWSWSCRASVRHWVLCTIVSPGKFSRQVYSLALRMVENHGQAEEIAQDVFMTVWTRGSTYRSDRGPFSSWLLSIAHNRCIDELRKRRRHTRYPTVDIDNLRHEPSGNPEEVTDAVFQLLDYEVTMEALNKLPAAQKQVIIMAYCQGLTQSEISTVLSTPLGTVKTQDAARPAENARHFGGVIVGT